MCSFEECIFFLVSLNYLASQHMVFIKIWFANSDPASETRNLVRLTKHALNCYTLLRPGDVRNALEQVQRLTPEARGLASKMKAWLESANTTSKADAKRIAKEQSAGGGVDDGSKGSGGAAPSTGEKRSSSGYESASGVCASRGGASKRGKRGGDK